jgi:hypothetical protein
LVPKKFGSFEAAERDLRSWMTGGTRMELEALLELKREAILGAWRDLIIKTYPPETSKFLGNLGDPFLNPLGHAISESIGQIYDEICSGMDTDQLVRALDGVIRIRSVQDFTASEAVSFIFDLKSVIQQVIDTELGGSGAPGELADLNSRIDRVALLTFEKYMACREKLHEIRINEIKGRMAKLLQTAGGGSAASSEKTGAACDNADACPVIGVSSR